VRARVANPMHALVRAVFNGWRLEVVFERRLVEEANQNSAAGTIQDRVRTRNQGKTRRLRHSAASGIQAAYRGKKSRQGQADSKSAATTIQAHVRRRQGRKRQQRNAEHRRASMAADDDLELTMNKALVHMSEIQKKERLRLMDVFRRMDRNNDGSVSLNEFEAELVKMKLNVSKDDLQEFFAALDPTASGFLVYKDLRNELASLTVRAQQEEDQQIAQARLKDTSSAPMDAQQKQQGSSPAESIGDAHDLTAVHHCSTSAFDAGSGKVSSREILSTARALGLEDDVAEQLFASLAEDAPGAVNLVTLGAMAAATGASPSSTPAPPVYASTPLSDVDGGLEWFNEPVSADAKQPTRKQNEKCRGNGGSSSRGSSLRGSPLAARRLPTHER